MQDYKRLEELWMLKHNKMHSLLLCCQKQKDNLIKRNFQKFFSLQEEKLKIIKEIDKIDAEIDLHLLRKRTEQIEQIRRSIKKEVEQIIQCEEAVKDIVERMQIELKRQLKKLGEGLRFLRRYRGPKNVESRFLNIKG